MISSPHGKKKKRFPFLCNASISAWWSLEQNDLPQIHRFRFVVFIARGIQIGFIGASVETAPRTEEKTCASRAGSHLIGDTFVSECYRPMVSPVVSRAHCLAATITGAPHDYFFSLHCSDIYTMRLFFLMHVIKSACRCDLVLVMCFRQLWAAWCSGVDICPHANYTYLLVISTTHPT